MLCKNPTCIKGCPVNINIPAFIQKIAEKDFEGSLEILKDKNNLPAICGRVCPQETQCEIVCVLAKKFQPVAIGRLERFIADLKIQESSNGKKRGKLKNKKIAVIGAGPASITCSGDLARMGYTVDVYESLHKLGGVLTYGIPPFRLPTEVTLEEINYVQNLGVNFHHNIFIGQVLKIEDLLKMNYKAVFIGTGAGLPLFMNIPGENLNRVYSANEFLTRINLMQAYNFPQTDTPISQSKKTVVIGGGNTAMDAARVALRLGAEVTVVYRRGEKEIPARLEEYKHAKEEGIKFHLLTAPLRFFGDNNGFLQGMECIQMKLGEPDSSGRRRPIPIENSNFEIECDTAVIAIGTVPNPIIAKSTPGLNLSKWGTIQADENGQTSIPQIFAGGDVVTGAATVIEAMGAGKKSAIAIDKFLTT